MSALPADLPGPAPRPGQAPALDPVERAVADLAAGRAVVVVDDADVATEGDLVLAAEAATPELLSFLIRHTSGQVGVPMTGADLDRLDLPLMVAPGGDSRSRAYTVTVDGVSLTVTAVTAGDFTVSLIPTTLGLTTLGRRAVGDRVNLEVDVMAKYVEKLLGGGAASTYTTTADAPGTA